jgi:hypothetical protein
MYMPYTHEDAVKKNGIKLLITLCFKLLVVLSGKVKNDK